MLRNIHQLSLKEALLTLSSLLVPSQSLFFFASVIPLIIKTILVILVLVRILVPNPFLRLVIRSRLELFYVGFPNQRMLSRLLLRQIQRIHLIPNFQIQIHPGLHLDLTPLERQLQAQLSPPCLAPIVWASATTGKINCTSLARCKFCFHYGHVFATYLEISSLTPLLPNFLFGRWKVTRPSVKYSSVCLLSALCPTTACNSKSHSFHLQRLHHGKLGSRSMPSRAEGVQLGGTYGVPTSPS